MTKFLHFLLPALALTACSNNSADRAATSAPAAPVDSFPLPAVPQQLTIPEERAAYAAEHFWDHALLPDSATAGLEQAMANFGPITDMAADTAAATRAARALIARADTPRRFEAVMEVAEHYLFDANSPVRNEELFIRLLQAAPQLSERRAALLEQSLKNRRGTTAASFAMVLTDGRRTTLAAEVAKAPRTLVYFFDTECPTCKEMIPRVAGMAAELDAQVVAVAPQANAGAMESVRDFFPAEWTVGSDLGDIDNSSLYFFPALPSTYLLDSRLTVLAKDL